MLPRSVRAFAALILFAGLLAGPVSAAEIQMLNGMVYSNVTITRQDASGVECYSKYGRIILPTAQIARIDGVPMVNIPVNPPLPGPAGASKPGPRAAPAAAARPAPVRPPRPAAPTVPAAATPAPSPTMPSWTIPPLLDPSQWSFTPLTLEILGGVVVWLASVFLVRRDLRRSPGARSGRWLLAAFFLPVVGALLYALFGKISHWRRDREEAAASLHEFVFLDAEKQPVMIEPGEVGSGLENAKGVLQAAIFDRASDVHVEPGAGGYRVRFRIDGILHPRISFPSDQGLRMISALKNVAQLDISERRKAQDGRFGGRAGGREVDFRAATTATVHGEKLVLRILDQKSGVRGLADLGMTPKMMERFAEVIQFRSGMILATGPTGSGKTSSLYAALTQLDAERLNIVTIEDPVEYELAGATQIPVNVKAGVTYESGLRSILRQDPDVILVGEMRDLEAAQITLRSALTGHLVFSSLHSRDAVGTIHRLEEMGIERHLLASALLVVLSQRLVRVLCPACRRQSTCVGDELTEIGIELPPGAPIYLAGGCKRCEGSGYVGRTGVFEMLVLNESLRQAINDGTPEDDFARSARTGGYREYREDGAEKVLLGITTVEEVLKAI